MLHVAIAMALKGNNVEKYLRSKICKSAYMGEPLVLHIINFCFELMQDFKSSFAWYNHSLKFSFIYSAKSKKMSELFQHWKRGNYHLLVVFVWIVISFREQWTLTKGRGRCIPCPKDCVILKDKGSYTR